jgi:hypothetical protein
MAEICTRIVQIFLAPKWHHYLLQYQPGPNNCRRHNVPVLLHITRHKKNHQPPPPPPPKLCPPARPPTTMTLHSMPRATCPSLILRHWPGTSRTGCLAMSARRRRRRGTFGNVLGRACTSSKEYRNCSTGTPSSQRVATQSTCFGHFNLCRCTRSRGGVRPMARLPVPSARRPTASGSGRLSTPLPTWST